MQTPSPQCLRREEQRRDVPLRCWTGNNLSFSAQSPSRHCSVTTCCPLSFPSSTSLFILFCGRWRRVIHSHVYGLLSVFEMYASISPHLLFSACWCAVQPLFSRCRRSSRLPGYLACWYFRFIAFISILQTYIFCIFHLFLDTVESWWSGSVKPFGFAHSCCLLLFSMFSSQLNCQVLFSKHFVFVLSLKSLKSAHLIKLCLIFFQ